MQGRTVILAAMLFMTIYGCTPNRAPQEPPVTAPAPTATEPAPVSVVPAAQQTHPELCAPLADEAPEAVEQRLKGLKGLLDPALSGASAEEVPAVIQGLADCLEVAPVEGSEGTLLVAELRPAQGSVWPARLAVWQYGGAWQSALMPLLDDVGTTPYPALYQEAPDGPNLIAVMRNRGTGHVGGFILLRFRSDLEIGWQSDLYGYFSVKLLGKRYFLATYRDELVYDEPHYYGGGCCYPTTGQTLWEVQGDRLMERASRRHPSVLRTASAFAGAWNQNRPDLAAEYAIDGLVVAAMAAGVPPVPEIALGLDIPKGVYPIEEAEAAYWDAVPPEFRGPEPTVTEFTWPSAPRPLLLRRVAGQWSVAGWGK